ncbi:MULTISPECIES: helix-turn-helix domain-containing protein [Bacteria]|uniref:helix-turn-helix domain-containing protein n=1 Tax=Bacteria TaxID=2 RepID=UPI003C7E4DC6
MSARPTTGERSRTRQLPLLSLGWTPLDPAPLRSSAELVTSGSWTIARLWSTAGTLRSSPLEAGTIRLILGVAGAADVTVNRTTLRLEPYEIVLLDGETAVRTESADMWARFEWRLIAPALQQPRFRAHFGRALALSREHYALLTTMSNVISTREAFGVSPGSGALQDAFAGAALAAVLDATDETEELSSSLSRILQEARRVIEARYTDESFDVATLAATLRLSMRHLRRPFAALGTTPAQAIEERRLAAADTVLDHTPARSRDTLEQVAMASGFSSVRRLRDALDRRRHRHRTALRAPAR